MKYIPFEYAMLRMPTLGFSLPNKDGENINETTELEKAALIISSPSLYEQLEKVTANTKSKNRSDSKFRRFKLRMSTRPTPYGLFSGVGLIRWGARTTVSGGENIIIRARADMEWLLSFVRNLESRPFIRRDLRWKANEALLFRGRRAFISNGEQYTSIVLTPPVVRALELARTPVKFDFLIGEVANYIGISAAKSERLIAGIAALGFLYSDLTPPMASSIDPIDWVRAKLKEITRAKAPYIQLSALSDRIKGDSKRDEIKAKTFDDTISAIKRTFNCNVKTALQVDTAFVLDDNFVNKRLSQQGAEIAIALLRLSTMPFGRTSVAGYRNAFISKYGKDREVPLIELAHPEIGLGHQIEAYFDNSEIESSALERRAELLQKLVNESIINGSHCVSIDDALIAQLELSPLDVSFLPTTLELSLFVLATDKEAIDRGEYTLLVGPNVGAQAGGQHFGRFADFADPEILPLLKEIMSHESSRFPDKVFAEVNYIPLKSRLANVALRPEPLVAEITYNCFPSSSETKQIDISDLVVGIDKGKFYIRSVSLNKQVMATSGHMLNMNNAPIECRLLISLSNDGFRKLSGFDWGPMSNSFFLPRIQYKKSILRCAHWRIPRVLFSKLAFAEHFRSWRTQWRIPRLVYQTEGDNRLLSDLDDPIVIAEMESKIKMSDVFLQEALPSEKHAWLNSPDGSRRVVEIVCPYRLSPVSAERTEPVFKGNAIKNWGRIRAPGSEWAFFKLYGLALLEDDLLCGFVSDLCSELKRSGAINEWFFVRYTDPDRHIRLRMRGAVDVGMRHVIGDTLERLNCLVNTGEIDRIVIDTYDREVERYGGEVGIDAAEHIFCADSEACVELLRCVKNESRYLVTIISIDNLLRQLIPDDIKRLSYLKDTVKLGRVDGKQYRDVSEKIVSSIMNPSSINQSIGGILYEREQKLHRQIAVLKDASCRGALGKPLTAIISSLLHMCYNRLSTDFGQEYLLLTYLRRSNETLVRRVNS